MSQAESESGERSMPMSTPVTTLTEHGFSNADIAKLQEAGYFTVESVAYASTKGASSRPVFARADSCAALITVKGVSEAKAAKLLSVACKLVPIGFTTATEFHSRRQDLISMCVGFAELADSPAPPARATSTTCSAAASRRARSPRYVPALAQH